jgi:glutamate 5-kinase
MKRVENALVLKVGTSTIVHETGGIDQLDTDSFVRIGRQVDMVAAGGRRVILVSSGARRRLPTAGWHGVVHAWDAATSTRTQDFLFTDKHLDGSDGWRRAFDVARMGSVAIVNANDVELIVDSPYRNNDLLAATLAVHIGSVIGHSNVQLGMLSDVPGVLTNIDNPDSIIPMIEDLDVHLHLAGGVGSNGATGGMATKFEAARLATTSGVRTWIAHGRIDGVIEQAMMGHAGTQFAI